MRKPGKILWREIEEVLSEDIANGVYKAGDRLPKEAELALRFGVNRHTIRQALAALRDRGAITIEQGRGMFVKVPKLAYPVSERTRFTENIAKLDLKVRGKLLRQWEEQASPQIAEDLAIAPGTPCVVFDDLRDIDGEVVTLTTRYFPAERFAGIADAFDRLGSVTAALKDLGIDDYTRRWTRVHARGATLEEAAALRVPSDFAILVVDTVNVDSDGVPIERGSNRSPGGRFELVFET